MESLLYISFDWPIAKFLGFVFFLITFVSGFWCILYLSGFSFYWITFGSKENLTVSSENFDYNKRKKLTEQEGIQIVYQKK